MSSSANSSQQRRIMLSAVKEDLYHPRLPTLRRMDMDDVGHKLPEAHSRTTTSCGPRDFGSATGTNITPPDPPLAPVSIMQGGRLIERYEAAVANHVSIPTEGDPDLRFSHYAVRYLKPDVTKSWRYTLVQEPRLDQHGRRPMPANIYARNRDSYPQYARNVAVEAWR